MRWAHLRAELARLERAGHLTDWTELGVDGVTFDAFGPRLDADTTDLRADLDLVRGELKDAEERATEAEKLQQQAEERETKAEEAGKEARDALAELRDPDSGVTVATYRAQAAEADKHAAQWREIAENAERRMQEQAKELEALRKRKGVEPGLVAHCWAVSGFLNTVAHYGDATRANWDERAADTLKRLGTEARELRGRIEATANRTTRKATAPAAP